MSLADLAGDGFQFSGGQTVKLIGMVQLTQMHPLTHDHPAI
jgi:hypothetical protein